MPVYEYECSNCQHSLEEFQSMSDKPLVKCPACKKHKLVRCIGVPMMVRDSAPKTLGSLADRNAAKMSPDEKKKIAEQQRTRRDEVLYEQLPKGMQRLEKPVGHKDPWYKKNQTVPTKKLGQMTDKQKTKYIKTGTT